MNKVDFGFYANLGFLSKLSWFKIYVKLGTISVDLGFFLLRSVALLENRAQTEPQFYARFALNLKLTSLENRD